MGLECLVTIMKSLVDWSKELHLNVDTPAMKGMYLFFLVVTCPLIFLLYPAESRSPSDDHLSQLDSQPSPEHLKFENKKKEKQLKQQLEVGKQKFNVDPEMVSNLLESFFF